MADYEDWIEQEEMEDQAPKLRAPRNQADPSNRKSVVLHDASGGAVGEIPKSSSTQGLNSSAERPAHSKLFPGMNLQTREEKIGSGKREEMVGYENRAPWIILALVFLAGGIVLSIFGGWCIQQAFEPSGTVVVVDACGPAGGKIFLLSFFFFLFFFFLFSFSFHSDFNYLRTIDCWLVG